MGKKMIAVNFLVVFLLLIITLTCLCSCGFNIYLPVEKPVPEHEHNKNRLVQDGEKGHHWECTVCNSPTDIEAHTYDEYEYCKVCKYKKGGGGDASSAISGFNAEIVFKEPSGQIEYVYEGAGVWKLTVKDKSSAKYPINKWTWYLFGEEQSTSSEYKLITATTNTYEVYCRFENENSYADSTVVIKGRTD